MQVAKGKAVALALAPERHPGVPAPGLISYDPILPLGDGLKGVTTPSGQVNRTAFIRKGLPGQKGGEFTFGLPLAVAHLIEFFAHVFGSVQKTVLEAGVYRYTFTPVLEAQHVRSLWGLMGREPVERELQHLIKLGNLAMTIGDNVEIPCVMTGLIGHGTRLGLAVPDAGNTGTYTRGPYVRGMLANEAAGDVHLQVTQVSPSLQFKVQQTDAAPAFPGPAVDALYDSGGEGAWQELQDHDGADLGIVDENKDPLELVWPGTAADHGDLAVGDVFILPAPGSWALPPMTILPAARRFTSAHWKVRARRIGDPAYASVDANGGSVVFDYPVERDGGNDSKYAFDIIRPGEFNPTVQLSRSLVNRFFADFLDRHERLDLQLAWEGRQLGATHGYREGLELTYPLAAVNEDARPPSAPTKIVETVNLQGQTDEAGTPPCTAVITTDRDWAVAA